jgi:DNA polymerase-4
LLIVPAGQETDFLAPLPVRSLWGVGPKTAARLGTLQIATIGDLARADVAELTRLVGSWGPFLQGMARGEDDRPITVEWERKSVGAERTFPRDLPDGPQLREELKRIAMEVADRLQEAGASARTISLKLRYSNFRTITRQRSVPNATADGAVLFEVCAALLERVARSTDRFRLLGVHASNLAWREDSQQRFWSG